jgi:hypothetical protein
MGKTETLKRRKLEGSERESTGICLAKILVIGGLTRVGRATNMMQRQK